MKGNLVWLLLAVVVVGWLWSASEQAKGALREQLRVADSMHVHDSLAHKVVSDSAVAARAEASRLRDAARREVRRDSVAALRTDSALRSSAATRTSALALVAGASRSVDSLRNALSGVVAASQRDSAAFAGERQQHQRTVAGFQLALQQDSVAISTLVSAEKAAVLRAVASEHQNEILRKQKPSIFSRCGISGGYAVNDKGAGPGIVVGCKFFP